MADKRISQLIERTDIANNDVVPIVASGASTTNKATISSIQTYMQENLDVGVTSVGITLGSSGTDVNVTGSPITTSGNITINIPTASATNRGLLSSADWSTFNGKQNSITLTTTGTSGPSTLIGSTLNIPNYTTDLSGYVTLGTAQTITAQKTFTTSGSSDTMIISHGSGSGFALDVIKAGNGEAIRVNKTSGTGNAMTIIGGNFEAPTIVKTGGTSTQFLKADGSVDSNTYVTTDTNQSITGFKSFSNGFSLATAGGTNQPTTFKNIGTIHEGSASTNQIGFNNSNNIYFGKGLSNGGVIQWTNTAVRYYTLPDADGTIALASQLGAYLPLTGGTLTGALNGTSASFTAAGQAVSFASNSNDVWTRYVPQSGNSWRIQATTGSIFGIYNENSASFPLTIASTGAATFSSSVRAANHFSTGGSTFATTSGQVGIGTSSYAGDELLMVSMNGTTNTQAINVKDRNASASSSTYMVFRKSDDTFQGNIRRSGSDNALYIGGNEYISFGTGGNTPHMRITSLGNVGIGTASPQAPLQVLGTIKVATGNAQGILGLGEGNGTTVNVGLWRGAANAPTTDGNFLNLGGFEGIVLATGAAAIGSQTERMRITPQGYLKASNTGTYFNTGNSYHELRSNLGDEWTAFITNPSASPYGIQIRYPSFASPNTANFFLVCSDSIADRLRISSNGDVVNQNNSYGAISDIKLKENIEDATPKLDDLLKVKIRNYNLIGNDKKQIGVIAQELEEVFPAMVDESEDFEEVEVPQLDEEGNEILNEEGEVLTTKQRVSKGTTTKSVKYSVFVPMLIKAIQEQQEQIDSLKNQIQTK